MVTEPDNRSLIRSGEAQLVGWSRQMLYSGFNILPRSVFWSADFNGRSDNLDVMWLSEFSAVDNRGLQWTRDGQLEHWPASQTAGRNRML